MKKNSVSNNFTDIPLLHGSVRCPYSLFLINVAKELGLELAFRETTPDDPVVKSSIYQELPLLCTQNTVLEDFRAILRFLDSVSQPKPLSKLPYEESFIFYEQLEFFDETLISPLSLRQTGRKSFLKWFTGRFHRSQGAEPDLRLLQQQAAESIEQYRKHPHRHRFIELFLDAGLMTLQNFTSDDLETPRP